MTTPFLPKQAPKFHPGLLTELQSNVSNDVARYQISLIPKLPPNATIHDNGCGFGAATSEMIASDTIPKDSTITATDVNPLWLDQLRQSARDENWNDRVKIDIMDACAVTYPDASFDLSVTNFVFTGLKDPIAAAKHIQRTLKVGGTAVVAIWNDISWLEPMLAAHYKTRGKEAPLPPALCLSLTVEGFVKVLADAGWEEEKMQWEDLTVWLQTKNLNDYVRLSWGFLGMPEGGWTVEDEERWEEALEAMKEGIRGNAEGYREKDGEVGLRMDARIVVLRK
ncbi:S-adenosyl-L-methionine-dependent methyltransferase [Amniculicola lignicola CBS 123094]|uniref:S-adenosyl-L-methionine-dependent methyltransferase n=1 Tax=Amniculicola lignicola CBS 123094 TaxID=1392246 RepID=A0A6A5WBS1_9PLEO|nr:S-adenosyl-L-methionine-dependent methyltransferase [Amniculicola lignicola CBS 123094]